MKFQPPKGTRDFMPAEMAKRRKAIETMRKVFENYGYGEVLTPAFEDFELLSKKAGPDIENEIYVFTDKAGRKLGLRFDLTVPICRLVASDPSLPKPIKFYYIGNVWRYDQPGKARWREFWQADVELIGSRRLEADAEVLAVVNDVLKSLGIKRFYFKINSRKIVEDFMKKAGIQEDKKFDVFRMVDKLEKIGEDNVRKELEKCKIPEKSIDKILELIKSGKADGLEELKNIKELAGKMGVENIKIDFSIVRGIDYYTGVVFETFVEGREDSGSVTSGGRYDTLIGLYGGENLPATGFGIGIDRLVEAIDSTKSNSSEEISGSVFVANVGNDLIGDVIRIVTEFRNNGVSAQMDLMRRNFGKQLEYANKVNIPYVLVVGKEELKKKKFKLKDMKTGKQREVSLKQAISLLK